MTALAADKLRERDGQAYQIPIPVAASTTIYQGALVCYNTSGYAVPAADTSGFRIAGVATAQVVNSGSAGDKTVVVERGQLEKIATAVVNLADSGGDCVVADDATVTDAAAGTNDVRVGIVERFETGFAWVRVGVFSPAAI